VETLLSKYNTVVESFRRRKHQLVPPPFLLFTCYRVRSWHSRSPDVIARPSLLTSCFTILHFLKLSSLYTVEFTIEVNEMKWIRPVIHLALKNFVFCFSEGLSCLVGLNYQLPCLLNMSPYTCVKKYCNNSCVFHKVFYCTAFHDLTLNAADRPLYLRIVG
jgi:hypothetical protein